MTTMLDAGHPAAGSRAPMSLPNDELARRIRAARAYAGYSVGELADAIGLGSQTIKRIETRRRTPRRLEVWAIAEACGVPRGFFEVDFTVLIEQAETVASTLHRIDESLSRIDLGVPAYTN